MYLFCEEQFLLTIPFQILSAEWINSEVDLNDVWRSVYMYKQIQPLRQ